jgi:hypothetical protein
MITLSFGSGGTYPYFWGNNAGYGANGAAMWVPGQVNGQVGGVMNDDYTIELVGNCLESNPYFPILCPALNGHTLTITDSLYHNGNPNGGHIWDLTAFAAYVNLGTNLNHGTVKFKGLNIRCNSGYMFGTNEIGANTNIVIDDCIITSSGAAGSSIFYWYGWTGGFNTQTFKLTRNKCYSASGYVLTSINWQIGTHTYENNDFIGKNYYDLAGTFRNNYIKQFNPSGGYFSNATGYNNRSDQAMTNANWAVGSTGNAGGVVASHEFTSTNPNDADSFNLRDGAILADAGRAPTLITEDIGGRSIPFHSFYPVGCHAAGRLFVPGFDYVPHSGLAPLPVKFRDTSAGVWF